MSVWRCCSSWVEFLNVFCSFHPSSDLYITDKTQRTFNEPLPLHNYPGAHFTGLSCFHLNSPGPGASAAVPGVRPPPPGALGPPPAPGARPPSGMTLRTPALTTNSDQTVTVHDFSSQRFRRVHKPVSGAGPGPPASGSGPGSGALAFIILLTWRSKLFSTTSFHLHKRIYLI